MIVICRDRRAGGKLASALMSYVTRKNRQPRGAQERLLDQKILLFFVDNEQVFF